MEYKFTVPGRLEGLNNYTAANRTNPYKGGKVKNDNENHIMWCIRQQLHGVHIEKPVLIYYHCFENDNRRDGDNILSAQQSSFRTVSQKQRCCKKITADASLIFIMMFL